MDLILTPVVVVRAFYRGVRSAYPVQNEVAFTEEKKRRADGFYGVTVSTKEVRKHQRSRFSRLS